MTKDTAEYIVKFFNKLDELNTTLERIAKALEGKDKREKKLLTEGMSTVKELTTTDKIPCEQGNIKEEYSIPAGYKYVPDGYHIERCFDRTKEPVCTCTTTTSYSAADLEYKIDTDSKV